MIFTALNRIGSSRICSQWACCSTFKWL